MALSLKKYRSYACKWLIPFAVLELVTLLCHWTGIAEAELCAIIHGIDLVFLFLPGAYFLTLFFLYRKKAGGLCLPWV